MCGIAGEINYSGKKYQADYGLMRDVLKRRGPDQDGIFQREYATLIHTRLSIVDLENGIQPMKTVYGEKEYCIVYNGELYNTEEIREQLKAKGHGFIGHSDTEVLLKSYVEWGEDCVNYLNGIFAFAIWDQFLEKLFIARDRMGVKPFFYYLKGSTFVFGSEIKAILAHPIAKPAIDINSIAEIMLIGPGRTPGYGVLKGIEELHAGSCGYFGKDGLKTYRYWKLEDKEHQDTFTQTVEKVRYLVSDAIEKQLVSDVPVCTFLSGGLDSSIISALSCKYLKNKGESLHTFSVDYLDNEKYFTPSKFQPNSDDYYINKMKDFLQTEHHKIIIRTPELIDALFKAVDARDLPGMADVDSSLLLFCKEVKEHAPVALSGECADEVFGGYPWYRDETIRNIDGFPWAQSTQYRSTFLKDEFLREIDPQSYVYKRYESTVEQTSKLPGLSPLESRMKEMTNLNLEWFMQTLLDRKDRMAMHNGLEVRVPFCDYRIVEYLYTVPWEMKNYEGREKGILRKAMEGILPEEVLWRKKSPYPKTHHPEYLEALSKLLQELISEGTSPILQFIKKTELKKLLTSNRSVPWYGQLMTTPQTIAYFLQIDYWMKRYQIRLI